MLPYTFKCMTFKYCVYKASIEMWNSFRILFLNKKKADNREYECKQKHRQHTTVSFSGESRKHKRKPNKLKDSALHNN